MVRKCFCALRQNAKVKGNRKQKPGWEHNTLSLKCLSSVERQMLVISWWNACAKIIFGLLRSQWTSSHALEVPGQTPLTAPAATLFSWPPAGARRGPEPPQGPFALQLCCAQGPSCPALTNPNPLFAEIYNLAGTLYSSLNFTPKDCCYGALFFRLFFFLTSSKNTCTK